MYESFELKVFKNINFLGEISTIEQTICWEQMYTRLSNPVDNHC